MNNAPSKRCNVKAPEGVYIDQRWTSPINVSLLLMIEILHFLKDPKLWEFWYSPYYLQCRIMIINRRCRFQFMVSD